MDFPIQNDDFPQLCHKLPEGNPLSLSQPQGISGDQPIHPRGQRCRLQTRRRTWVRSCCPRPGAMETSGEMDCDGAQVV